MSSSPLVSVIIPTYNRPEFLKRTIHSILAQTYPNLELIVVSNGFNVVNKKTVQSFKNSRITYLEQENSGGPAAPRNRGILHAQGKYVAFCDDDDLWMPNKLEKQVYALESNVDYGLCYTNMVRFNDEKEWNLPNDHGKADLDSLLYNNTIAISSVILKKELINKFGCFCESKIVGVSEDYEFLLRYAVNTKFLYIDDSLVKYWSGNNRTTFDDEEILGAIKYFLGVLGCYYYLVCNKQISITKIFFPVFNNIKIYTKIIGYKILKKIRVR
jgi:glycosyltransferase involved in cell wall biosynthesis